MNRSYPESKVFSFIVNALIVLSILIGYSLASEEFRTWTRGDGKTVEAQLVEVSGKVATLRLRNGNTFDIDVLQLSLEDQKFVADQVGLNAPSPTNLPPAVGVSFPLSDPSGYPARPGTPCRIVVVKMPTAASEMSHAAFEQIEKDDLADLVKFGDAMRGANVLAIRGNGEVVLWRDDGEKIDPPKSDALVALNGNFKAPLLWVESDGTLRCETDDHDLERELRRIGEVVRLRLLDGGLFAITSDKKRHLFSPNRLEDMTGAGIDLQSLVDFAPAAGNSFWVVDRKGVSFHFQTRRLEKKSDPGVMVALPHSHLRQRADGKFEGFAMAYAFALGLQWDPGIALPEIFVGGGAAAHRATEDGKWDILIQDEKWEINEKLTGVFEDAVDLHMLEGRYLYALFPAETVPRSGYWDLDELIAARKP